MDLKEAELNLLVETVINAHLFQWDNYFICVCLNKTMTS